MPERGGEAALAQHRRIDALRESAEVVDGRGRVIGDLVELGGELVVVDPLAEEAELDLDRHQPLLGAVVEIALDLAPLGFPGGDDSLSRSPKLVDLRPELVLETPAFQREQDGLPGRLNEFGIGLERSIVNDDSGGTSAPL